MHEFTQEEINWLYVTILGVDLEMDESTLICQSIIAKIEPFVDVDK